MRASGATDIENAFLAGTESLAEAIRRAGDEDASSLPLLDPDACEGLMVEARALNYRPARPVVGVGETAVYQDFDLATEFYEEGALPALAKALDRALGRALRSMKRPPLDEFPINDLILQRYPRGSAGITAHRDHIRYTGLVAIVVLAGAGRFFVSSERGGTHEREVTAPAGHLLLMRAPGFQGRNDRPFHAVREVTEERYVFGLRHDSRPERWDA